MRKGKHMTTATARGWKRTVDIKACFKDREDGDSRQYGKEIAALLRKKLADVLSLDMDDETRDGIEFDFDFEMIVLDFDDIIGGQDDFNEVLARLYDWADYQRVWLGI